jgi:hypothetical protein
MNLFSITHDHFYHQDKATADQLSWIIRGIGTLNRNMEKIMIDTSKILAAVADEKTKVDSLIALSAGQSATMKDLAAKLAAAIAANDPAATAQVQADLDKAATDLSTETAAVSAAIDANTPPAP